VILKTFLEQMITEYVRTFENLCDHLSTKFKIALLPDSDIKDDLIDPII
jgi:hypothetical protein